MTDDRGGRAAFAPRAPSWRSRRCSSFSARVVIFDSVRLGFGWQEVHGPRPGYFPFYIGLLICISAVVNVVRALRMPPAKNKAFVSCGQLKLVLTRADADGDLRRSGYLDRHLRRVGAVHRLLHALAGQVPLVEGAAVSIVTVVVFYLMFEIWFKVPLPKGPLETLLGLN